MVMELCEEYMGVVWWVWFDRTVCIHAKVYTFVHTVYIHTAVLSLHTVY